MKVSRKNVCDFIFGWFFQKYIHHQTGINTTNDMEPVLIEPIGSDSGVGSQKGANSEDGSSVLDNIEEMATGTDVLNKSNGKFWIIFFG